MQKQQTRNSTAKTATRTRPANTADTRTVRQEHGRLVRGLVQADQRDQHCFD